MFVLKINKNGEGRFYVKPMFIILLLFMNFLFKRKSTSSNEKMKSPTQLGEAINELSIPNNSKDYFLKLSNIKNMILEGEDIDKSLIKWQSIILEVNKRKEIGIQIARYNRLKKEFLLGQITQESFDIERNKITDFILNHL